VNLDLSPLPSYLAKSASIDAAWELCEARLAALPTPLDELGTRFLASIGNGVGGHRLYFSTPLSPPLLYMPLWLADGLRERGRLPSGAEEALVKIVAGTMLGYFYIRIQDDAIDEPTRADAELLLLGNALFTGMVRMYRDALPDRDAPFLEAFDRAWSDFSRLTLAEQRAVRGADPYPAALFEEHADKVAFARVPMLAVAAIAGTLDFEASITSLVRRLGVAYGLTNDAFGWPRDLAAGQRTYLLAAAGLERADLDAVAREPESREALAERVRSRLYEGGQLRRVLREAGEWHRRAAEDASAMGLAGFDAFTAERLAWLEAMDRQVLASTLKRALTAKIG
jgi:hypothetical protein